MQGATPWLAADLRMSQRHVADDGPHVDVREKSVVRRNKDEALVDKSLRLGLHACLVIYLPTTAMKQWKHDCMFGFRLPKVAMRSGTRSAT